MTLFVGCGKDVPTCDEVCDNTVSQIEECGGEYPMDECVAACEATNQPECKSEFDAAASCAVDQTIDCETGEGSCDTETVALLTCVQSIGGDEGEDDTGSW